jgi:DNA-binding transcriptional MerR regulator
MKEAFKLADLADAAGIEKRTLRFYIARGLLPGPSEAGRNAVYGQEHLDRLAEISRLKKKGLTLTEIGRELYPSPAHERIPTPTAWQNYALSADVTVQVRTDVAPWRMRMIRSALAELTAVLRKESSDEHGKS